MSNARNLTNLLNSTGDEELYKTVQYDQTIGLLVEAIKELSAKVEELENK